MAQKFGWSICGSLTGWILAYFGYEANQVQDAAVLEGLRHIMSFLPAVGTILSVVFIAFYPVNEKFLRKTNSELNRRRHDSI